MYRDRSEVEKSVGLMKKALEIDLDNKNSYGAAYTYFELAKSYRDLESIEKSREYAESAREIFCQLGLQKEEEAAAQFLDELSQTSNK